MDTAFRQILNSHRLARVQRDKYWDWILRALCQNFCLSLPIGQPLCESLDEVGFARGKLLFFPAEAAA